MASRNCAQTIQNALSRAKLKAGYPSLKQQILRGLGRSAYPLGSEVADRMPNIIYNRIKEQNEGTVIPYKKK